MNNKNNNKQTEKMLTHFYLFNMIKKILQIFIAVYNFFIHWYFL